MTPPKGQNWNIWPRKGMAWYITVLSISEWRNHMNFSPQESQKEQHTEDCHVKKSSLSSSTIADYCTNLNMTLQVKQGYALHVTCANMSNHQREMLQLKEDEEEAVKKIPLGLRKEKERKSLTMLFLTPFYWFFLVLEANLSNPNVATTQNIIIVSFSYFPSPNSNSITNVLASYRFLHSSTSSAT